MPVQLLISDANLLIDMDVAGLLDRIFELPFEYVTPESLFEEELRSWHADLLEKGLRLKALTPELINRVESLSGQYKGVSIHDLSALILAEHSNAPLLTGDKKLRQVCMQESVDVRGTLWLMEHLMLEKLITVEDAKIAYQRMAEDGSRLPWDEVDKQLKHFMHK
ncbi:DUF3368 domain-containing protein [Pseudomonadota bacterium]